MQTLSVFGSHRNPVFAQLYAAQTVSLLGDALTWVALALLAFDLAGQRFGVVLGVMTHEVKFAQDVADRVVFMADGVVEGSPNQVLVNPQHPRTRSFL